MSEQNMSKESVTQENAPEWDMPEYDISEEEEQKAARQKRNQSMKGGNLLLLRISIAILIVLCAVLLVRIHRLNRTIENLASQTERLVQIVTEQQESIKELTDARDTLKEQQDALQQAGSGNVILPQSGEAESASQATPVAEVEAAHKVYLTFDDGPSANTLKILDILEEYGVKATFFTVGTAGEGEEETLKKIVEAGHTLGMHSYTHDYAGLYSSVEDFAADFARQQEFLYGITGVKSTVYRFPGGSSNQVSYLDMKEFAEYLDRQGVRFFDWNVSSGDGGSFLVPVETLVDNCTGKIGNYSVSVVLMHDSGGKSTTVEALPMILEKIQAMEDTVILPITEGTVPVQHIHWQDETDTED